jgi:L-seryl-tRNA(Ser) seleniumtransferase
MARKPKKAADSTDPRSKLASVAAILEHLEVQVLAETHSRALTLEAVQAVQDWLRAHLEPGDAAPDMETIVDKVREVLAASGHDRIRRVVNATGIILHTGLGRAVLPQRAVDALAEANRCVNLQIDLETGLRGKRNYMTEQLLCKLTGAEAAMVVNNNAGATLLLLAALCGGREVVVSRGQLIEIGGSYRLPDCIHQSGAALVEVGTTNKTHLRDYEAALTENTAALMRVNPSNYRVIGFSQEVSVADLVALKKEKAPNVVVIDDLGCGALVNLEEFGLPHEPTAPDSVAAGADIVCFSGDKLIGGPQAGIIVGRKDLIQKIRKHPLTRMLRVGKLTDLALEHTLRLFLERDTLQETNPTIRMITLGKDVLKRRATALKRRLDREGVAIEAEVAEGESATGGGSLPGTPIATYVLAIRAKGVSADELCQRLRRHDTPVIARIKDDQVVLDMRTLMDGDDAIVVAALRGTTCQ